MSASGGAVASVYDLAVCKNDDTCQPEILSPVEKMAPALPEAWSNGYVFSLDVSSFSTFFFAGDQHTVLPVRLLSFKGEKQAGFNYLKWEAALKGPVEFTLERSGDGKSFVPIDHQVSGGTRAYADTS